MKIAICSSSIPQNALSELAKYTDKTVLMPPFEALDIPVSAHPDMLIFPTPEIGVILTHKEYLPKAEKLLKFTGLKIIPIEESVGRKYPHDILLNAARIGDRIFGRLSGISQSLLDIADKLNLERIDIKQGYARCSICSVSDSAIITADPSIEKAAKGCGIDVLSVSQNGVILPGYDCGFIGGASGTDGENIFFCGDILSHPNGEMIINFCRKHGKNPISLSNDPLLDIGSIFIIDRC